MSTSKLFKLTDPKRGLRVVLAALGLLLFGQLTALADTVTFQWKDGGSGAFVDSYNSDADLGDFTNAAFTITATTTASGIPSTSPCALACVYLDVLPGQATISISGDVIGGVDNSHPNMDFGAVVFTFGIETSAFINQTTGEEGFGEANGDTLTLYEGPTVSVGPVGNPWSLPSGISTSGTSSILDTWLNLAGGGVPVTGSVTCVDTNSTYKSNCNNYLAPDVGALDLQGLTDIQPDCIDTTCYSTGTFSASESSVPEPSSALLLGFGLTGALVVFGTRRRVSKGQNRQP